VVVCCGGPRAVTAAAPVPAGLATGLVATCRSVRAMTGTATSSSPASASPAAAWGVHSEVGVLRKVLVCAPGLAHQRLTPTNCDELLFDDVLWVQNARRDHFDFVARMRGST
jgi:hypothetical protein